MAATTRAEKPVRSLSSDEHLEKGASITSPPLHTQSSFSPEAEKRLIRKIDFKIVPFLSLLYLLSFLDRVNIGQARLNGLEKNLGLKGNQYSICLLVFFVSYVAFETPAVIFVKRLRPSRFLPTVMVGWGLVMTLMGIVHSFTGLAVARFFLGLCESPLFPAACFYLTSWYKRKEQNIRISIFFSSATLSGAFGGILAYALSQMNGIGGLEGWRWIFIIEGMMTFVIACIAPFLMTDFPEEAKFLDEDEQAEVIRRLRADRGPSSDVGFSWAQVRAAFTDWKTYVYMLIYIGVAEPLYSLALFTPTIISSLGKFSRAESQLLSTPPYFLAFIITLTSALYSDRIGNRGNFNVFWMTIVVIGYAILLAVDPKKQPGVALFALFFCVGGVAPCISNSITWIGNNYVNHNKRAAAMGAFFSLGNSGGIVSSLVYPATTAPRYRQGHAVGLGFAAMALLLSLFLSLHFRRENRRKDEKYGQPMDGDEDFESLTLEQQTDRLRAWGLEGMSRDDMINLGEEHPAFRYIP